MASGLTDTCPVHLLGDRTPALSGHPVPPSVSPPPWVLSACFAIPSSAPKANEVRLQEGYSAKSVHRLTVFIPFSAFYPLASDFSATGQRWPTSPEYQVLKGQAGEPHRGRVHGEPREGGFLPKPSGLPPANQGKWQEINSPNQRSSASLEPFSVRRTEWEDRPCAPENLEREKTSLCSNF